MAKKIIRKNTYDLSGEYGIGYTLENEPFYFDLEDYDLIKDYYWSMDKKGYVIGTKPRQSQITLHVLLMPPKVREDIEHINNIHFDNRKSNLKRVAYQRKRRDIELLSNNKCGITGITFDLEFKKWIAKIRVNSKSMKLGEFDNFEDALIARRNAEEKYFGEYRRINKLNVKHMSKQEYEEYDELYEYVRSKIMGYDESQSLSSQMNLRLKGLKVNKHMENYNIKDTANYSYKLILITYKFCSVDIDKAFKTKSFKNELQRFNYAAAIVESNLNTVYERMKNTQKAEEKTQTMDVKTATHTGASYQRKTKETASNLEELW